MRADSNKTGFTLVEALVALAIFGIILAILSNFLLQGMRFQTFASEQQQQVEFARSSAQTMVKELREAEPGDDGSYILNRAEDQEIIFFSNIDADQATERVRYFLDGTTFKKGIIEPSGEPIIYDQATETVTTLVEYIRNGTTPIFLYYNGDYPGDMTHNPLPTPTRLTETKLLNVYLRINVNESQAPNQTEVITEVQIRNLKNNL